MENVYGNQMHLLKKMDYKGFMASLCGVLMVILSFFLTTSHRCLIYGPHMTLFEVKNFQYESKDELLTIQIPRESGVVFDEKIIVDESLSALGRIIEDEIFNRQKRDVRIRLKADQAVPYGKIVQVFQILSKVGIKSVFLVTKGSAYPMIDFITNKKITK